MNEQFVILMSPNGAFTDKPQLFAQPVETPKKSSFGWLHIAATAFVGYQSYLLATANKSVEMTTSTSEYIIGSTLIVLSITGWITYFANYARLKGNPVYATALPVVLTILGGFSIFYLFSYVWDMLCDDNDPDDCAEEANVILLTFVVFFLVILYTVYCFYKFFDKVL